jgi:membrane protein DedA with SNARE-associated domain
MVEWITQTIDALGYWGIGWLMLLENVFPPIPSELIMPLAGFTVAQGKMALMPAIAAGTVGSILGALPWYALGRWVGEVRIARWLGRHGRWLGLSPADVARSRRWFERWGTAAVFFGRLVPGIRTLISVPAGLEAMAIAPFLLYSTLGSALWVALLTGAGYLLGDRYELVAVYLGPVAKGVLGGLLVVIAALLLWRHWQHTRSRKE